MSSSTSRIFFSFSSMNSFSSFTFCQRPSLTTKICKVLTRTLILPSRSLWLVSGLHSTVSAKNSTKPVHWQPLPLWLFSLSASLIPHPFLSAILHSLPTINYGYKAKLVTVCSWLSSISLSYDSLDPYLQSS